MASARERFERFVRSHHPYLSVEDLEIASSPGYWRVRGGCPGGDECRHGFRGALGPCDGGGEATVYFAEVGRDEKGRFLSPHRAWKELAAAGEREEGGSDG